ncbi:MAG: phenylacetate--CoA ligase family protein [Flavobacteriaceae bacterium]|nr:phenylacetate--CoA ligase family protein [Flavobacteriaceae bacterium]
MMIRNIFLEKFVLPIGDAIFNGNFSKKLKYWRKFKDYSESDLEHYQEEKLRSQLEFAIQNVNRYKHISYSSVETTAQLLSKFPILTKDFLRENPNELKVKTKQKTTRVYSSGSTGVSTYVEMSTNDLTSLQALQYHLWELCGYKIGDSVFQTGISPNRTFFKKLKDVFLGAIYIPAFALTQRDLEFICNKLTKKNKYTLIGYPSSINVIAAYVFEKNLKVSAKRVIGLGDTLFPHYKKNIEKAFCCAVFETYGASEGFQIGFQVDLDFMYLFTPQVYLELLDDNNNPVKDGEIGNVVVTRLDNKQMPLIRYRIGDLAIKLPREKYPKYRKFNFPLLEKVIGRNTDIVVLPDNRKMIVHSFTGIFEYIDEIKQFKIIQKDRKGITIQYIPSKNFTKKILDIVKQKLQEHILDDNFLIDFVEVTLIKSSKSGKPQIIESFLK